MPTKSKRFLLNHACYYRIDHIVDNKETQVFQACNMLLIVEVRVYTLSLYAWQLVAIISGLEGRERNQKVRTRRQKTNVFLCMLCLNSKLKKESDCNVPSKANDTHRSRSLTLIYGAIERLMFKTTLEERSVTFSPRPMRSIKARHWVPWQ